MEYKVGDKFEVEIEKKIDDVPEKYYRLKNLNGVVFSAYELSKLKRIKADFSKVNWSNVKVDTPILVSENETDWFPRHFAKYEDGTVYAFNDGKTSFTARCSSAPCPWDFAKLAVVEE